jgi:hypothetical protein
MADFGRSRYRDFVLHKSDNFQFSIFAPEAHPPPADIEFSMEQSLNGIQN